MQKQFVLPSKRRVDIVSVVADFTGLLPAGEVIVDGVVSIQVFSGVDPAPEDLLDGTIFVSDQQLRHRIKLGVPGVVYQLVFQAITSSGYTVEVECRQAVLVDEMPVEPVYQTFFFTSKPYPLNLLDEVVSIGTITSGRTLLIPLDEVGSSGSIVSGSLDDLIIYYSLLPEAVGSSGTVLSGTMRDVILYYSMQPEAVSSAGNLVSGSFKNVIITYSNYPPEGVGSTGSVISGTLL